MNRIYCDTIGEGMLVGLVDVDALLLAEVKELEEARRMVDASGSAGFQSKDHSSVLHTFVESSREAKLWMRAPHSISDDLGVLEDDRFGLVLDEVVGGYGEDIIRVNSTWVLIRHFLDLDKLQLFFSTRLEGTTTLDVGNVDGLLC